MLKSNIFVKEAGVAELVDVLDLGSSAARRGGSSPFTRTNFNLLLVEVFLNSHINKIT